MMVLTKYELHTYMYKYLIIDCTKNKTETRTETRNTTKHKAIFF